MDFGEVLPGNLKELMSVNIWDGIYSEVQSGLLFVGRMAFRFCQLLLQSLPDFPGSVTQA